MRTGSTELNFWKVELTLSLLLTIKVGLYGTAKNCAKYSPKKDMKDKSIQPAFTLIKVCS